MIEPKLINHCKGHRDVNIKTLRFMSSNFQFSIIHRPSQTFRFIRQPIKLPHPHWIAPCIYGIWMAQFGVTSLAATVML